MPDVYLYSVPSDADQDDVRLRDPTTASSPSASSAAPVSAVAVITAAGQKGALSAAPVSAVAAVTAAGFKAAQSAAPMTAVAIITAVGEATVTADAGRDPGTKGKPWLYEVPLERAGAGVESAPAFEPLAATVTRAGAKPSHATDAEDEEAIWLLVA